MICGYVETTVKDQAEDMLSDSDLWSEDVWEDEEDFESKRRSIIKRRLESRRREVKKARNEDVKRLPNGMVVNRVSDVLSNWAGTSSTRPKAAIHELDRKGILMAATNKWYPTVEDVSKAIEDCWNDNIGMVGAGAAKFFIGQFGGATKCSLMLYQVTGGTSRARNLVLKFDWPENQVEEF